MVSAFIFSGCTAGRPRVQPYRERPTIPEQQQQEPVQPRQQIYQQTSSYPTQTYPEQVKQQEPVHPRQQIYQRTSSYPTQTYPEQVKRQDLPPAEQLAYNRQVLQPIRSTIRGRVSFYAQRTKSWQELEQNKSQYRTPEQSRKLISCQSKVAALHDAYTTLQIQLFNDRNIADSREKVIIPLQHLQNRDFTYLEGSCPSLFKKLSTKPQYIVTPRVITNPTTISGNNVFQPRQPDFSKPNFSNYPQNRTPYGQNVNSHEADPLALTDPMPNYEERYQYAQSLLKRGKEQESRRLFSDLLASVRPTGNRTLQIKILKKISELEFALRNYLPARILYEELQQLHATFDKQHLAALQSVDSQREKVDAYASLLLSSMTSNPEQDGFTVVQQARTFVQNFPDSPLRSNVENLEAKAEQEAEQWFQGLLRHFDFLVANQQQQDALALLKQVPLDILPLDKQDIIQQRKDSLTVPPPPVRVDFPPSPTMALPDVSVTGNNPQEGQNQPNTANQAQAATVTRNVPQEAQNQPNTVNQVQARQPAEPAELSAQKKISRSSENKEKASNPPEKTADTALQKKWVKAEEAFQAAEYDKAIALYSNLLNTSLDAKARKKIKKASLAAGQEARRKAANFFQRANSATDPKARKQHLLSSKTLLEDILQKYPLAGLDTKVKRNLSRVDKELAALDHTSFE
ncbi:MAG: hypothetical protein Q3M30_15760 [Candidatus Electrothrix sp. Rat3]|nr:hypothetical protein [Candidatus Electrothrix rattekaaiensis]